jgi:hypothetical protein
MNGKTNYWQSITAVLAAALALTMAPATGSAQQVITPDNAQAETGMTYGEWSAVWWQYVLSKSVSNPDNPLLDPTGVGCKVDQPNSSPVFFLVGSLGNSPVTRNECTVPGGKVLFFPLVNAFDVHVPGDGLDTPELVRQDLLAVFGRTTELHASIDGVPVGVNLFSFGACAGGDPACASAFSITFTGNNLFVGSPAGIGRRGAPQLRAGIYAPAVADGFYLMLAPLLPGAHTIKFGGQGSFAGSPSSQEITYNLVVKKR